MNIEQWRNQNENAHYPFLESAGLKSIKGVNLSESFLVDAQIYVPAGLAGDVWLSSLILIGDRVIGVVKVGTVEIGRFSVEASLSDNTAVELVDDYSISRGRLVMGSRASVVFTHLALGENAFLPNQTSFEASCIFRHECLSGLDVGGFRTTGKIALIEGEGIQLVRESENVLRIDAVGSSRRIDECCEPTPEGGLKKINEAIPNAFGTLLFDLGAWSEPNKASDLRQILRIRPDTNGLIFTLTR